MATHQVGETVLALDPAALIGVSSLDEVGLNRFYRAVSIGSDPSLPEAVSFTNEAASLKPYAPVHIRGGRNGGAISPSPGSAAPASAASGAIWSTCR